MEDYDDVEMAKDEDTGDLVFTAVKTSKTRNLEGDVVETETRNEVTRIPDHRELGLEVAEQLEDKYDRDTTNTEQNKLGDRV